MMIKKAKRPLMVVGPNAAEEEPILNYTMR